MQNKVAFHYDLLIDQNNDPVRDPEPLRKYMDKWDGQEFLNKLMLDKAKTVLEIGIGTGRLALRTAPLCKKLYGIDISPKTIARAGENLSKHNNIALLCGDFMTYGFERSFDVIYSSLTFMHIKDKQAAINKISSLLKQGGVFALSIDKNQSRYIDTGANNIKIYPDAPDKIKAYIISSGLRVAEEYETELAVIFIANKPT